MIYYENWVRDIRSTGKNLNNVSLEVIRGYSCKVLGKCDKVNLENIIVLNLKIILGN